jgi:hypothetical protein
MPLSALNRAPLVSLGILWAYLTKLSKLRAVNQTENIFIISGKMVPEEGVEPTRY